MIPRHQLAVHSPIRAAGLRQGVRAAVLATVGRGHGALRRLEAALASGLGARRIVLYDSGTSALVSALRTLAGRNGIAALPGYGCIDLAAAAVAADVRVRLYDVDPHTLSPDPESLQRVVREGVDAIVVAHYFGMPADVPTVAEIAAAAGVPVIEDAAQGLGAELSGRAVGSLGDVAVLSFGRGKGVTGGAGGALVAMHPSIADTPSSVRGAPPSGWRDLAAAAVQRVLGHPAVYAIPNAIPGLQLGEMVYRAADEPSCISAAAAALATDALANNGREIARRRCNAAVLRRELRTGGGVEPIEPIAGAVPSYLRLPILAPVHLRPARTLGVHRPYPQPLEQQRPLASLLLPSPESLNGARELSRRLLSVPTHRFVTESDLRRILNWLDHVVPQHALARRHVLHFTAS